jgi:hypothetical protein
MVLRRPNSGASSDRIYAPVPCDRYCLASGSRGTRATIRLPFHISTLWCSGLSFRSTAAFTITSASSAPSRFWTAKYDLAGHQIASIVGHEPYRRSRNTQIIEAAVLSGSAQTWPFGTVAYRVRRCTHDRIGLGCGIACYGGAGGGDDGCSCPSLVRECPATFRDQSQTTCCLAFLRKTSSCSSQT